MRSSEPVIIDYKDIPGFPVSTVAGHAGRLVFGNLSGKEVVCMQGRVHSYEGLQMWKATLPVRVMKLLGARVMIATNAAGGLNPEYAVGDIMVMKDHISLPGMSGQNPLIGPNVGEFGPRFSPMTRAYDRELRKMALRVADEHGLSGITRCGVYVMVSGPSYETPAECTFLRNAGADVVGMSTAPEVTVGVHCGFKCLGFSLVTNACVLDVESDQQPNHEEVIAEGKKAAVTMNKLMTSIVAQIDIEA